MKATRTEQNARENTHSNSQRGAQGGFREKVFGLHRAFKELLIVPFFFSHHTIFFFGFGRKVIRILTITKDASDRTRATSSVKGSLT